MELSNSSVVLNLNPNSKTFGYQDVDVTASTNYEAGYELKMSTSDNSTNLKRDATADSVNASINTLAATSPTTTGYTDSDFSNCADSNTNCMNKWGYKNGIANNYFPFSSGAKILENTTATNGDTTTLRFAAKINYDQPAGTYNTELIFTATAKPIIYDINYYDLDTVGSTVLNDSGITWNNPTSGTAKEASYTTIATQASSSTAVSTITLNPSYLPGKSAPSRHTYTFAGWCLGSVNNTVIATQNASNKVTAYDNPSTRCTGTVYQVGDNIQLDPSVTNNINFYALWTPTTFAEAGVTAGDTMQTMTAAKCNNTTPNQFTTMKDARGSSASAYVSYTVIKLLDGNCWMADNLDLDVYAYKANLTTSNTHADSTALDYFKNGGNTSTTNRYSTGAINSSYSASYTDPSPVSHATQDWNTFHSYTIPLANRHGSCSSSCSGIYGTASYTHTASINYLGGDTTKPYNIGVGSYKIGTYYNYCAASAGYYCYDSASGTGSSAYDICPSNWKMPTGDQAIGSYYRLYQKISDITVSPASSTDPLSLQAMLSTPLSGYYVDGNASAQGNIGYFWSSTRYDNAYIYTMTSSKTAVSSQNSHPRTSAFSVRCLAQN